MWLTEQGFVFIDDANRPYHVRMWEGEPWVFYWHPDGHWVSLRKVDQLYVWSVSIRALPDNQAQMYHDKHAASQSPLSMISSEK